MHVMAGSLQVYACTKPTLCITILYIVYSILRWCQSNKVKPYNYIVHTNDPITKHTLSDKKWYDWLTGWVAAVGRCYGLALELQKVPSTMANNL